MTPITCIARDREHLSFLIEDAVKMQSDACSLNHIDVSNVTDMHGLFQYSRFNGDISAWDVSNVRDMNSMFAKSTFEGDLSKWTPSCAQSMENMFAASWFNGDISNWRPSKLVDARHMFINSKFRGDISRWELNEHCEIDFMHNIRDLGAMKAPMVYHWMCLATMGDETPVLPREWLQHFNEMEPLVKGLGVSTRQGCQLIHAQWLKRVAPSDDAFLTLPPMDLDI